MKFYRSDESSGELRAANPYRVCVREEGINITCLDPDTIFYVTTENRAIFGLNGEKHHEDLKPQLGDEVWEMRGVIWPKHKATTIWVTNKTSNVYGLRENMSILAEGVRTQLGMDPSSVNLYTSWDYNGCSFVVVMTLQEAAELNGYGDCSKYFYEAMAAEESRQQQGNAPWQRTAARNMWRHYEVVGEQKKPIKMNESELLSMITECVRKIISKL
jgi:hypothetical protein